MTRPNHHRIQRQIVELVIGSAVEGPAVYRELANPFWDRALPDLQQIFDAAAGPDELLRFDRLELDLGTIGGGDWPSEFRKKLAAELVRNLGKFTAGSTPDLNVRRQAQSADACRQFLFFLTRGYLPWWSGTAAERWDEAWLRASEAEWSALRGILRSDPRARTRLVHSFRNEFLERAIGAWSGAPDAAKVFEVLRPELPGTAALLQWRRDFWLVLLEWAVSGAVHPPNGGPRLVRELLALRDRFAPDGEERRASHADLDDSWQRYNRRRTAEDHDLPEPWRGWLLSQAGAAPFEPAMAEPRTGSEERKGLPPVGLMPHTIAPKKIARAAEDGGIYLPGAGAIIVHPFLEALFAERGLLDGRNFRDRESRNRAVHLIGYVTFGGPAAEYVLALAKTICGLELEEPLDPVPLEDDDIAACDELLRAILLHWTALRSSSPDWLRAQFFLRGGKLESTDSGWLLTLERRAQDVLLARLPWGFGVVAPPWLPARIFVRWLE